MPVISEILVILREPSLSRVCCTTNWIADAICRAWRAPEICRAHGNHGFDAVSESAGVGVIVVSDPSAGIHRLQHVQRFLAADLSDDDPVRTHSQGVDHELALSDGTLALDVGRTGLQPRHVVLVQLQLRGVLDRDDAPRARR
jgi:hypothetical protein